jgi:hypothetical protein
VVSRLIDEPITVHVTRSSVLSAFIWRRRLYRVNGVLGWWREPGKWWKGETVRLFVRVSAAHGTEGTYELCRIDGTWYMYKVLD